jgi:hypothetical protein
MQYFRNSVLIVFCAMLICGFEFGFGGSHDSFFSKKHLLTAEADELNSTVVSAHLEVPVNSGKNIVWCSTFQLAWNKVCDLIGEDVHFEQDPPMVKILNKRQAKESDIDAMSYVARVGHIRDGILKDIKSELERKFKGAARPKLIPSGVGMRPQDIVTYSYLFKNLEFPVKFERLKRPVVFDKSEVSCFGIGNKSMGAHIQMFKQVSILDYKDRDDFIIELKTKSPIDQFILVKTNSTGTLKTCVDQAIKRMSSGTPSKMQYGDILKIPKMNYDIHRQYDELMGKKLKVVNPNIAKDLIVLSAEQSIRFQMDEEGVKLKSESKTTFGCSKSAPEPQPQHIMIFDKPFLVLLKNSNANTPYFAMWVSNPELLVPWK